MEEVQPKPNLLLSLLSMKCPRCRRGDMFVHSNGYKKLSLKYMLEMPKSCPVCEQDFELETGFWYGTGYVSYGIAVLLSVVTFLLWWLIVGLSTTDDRLLYYVIFNAVLMVVLQPWLMRISRVVYLYFFVRYNGNYTREKPIKFT